MRNALQPAVLNFQGKKHASRPENAVNLGKRSVLLLNRPQMMKDQDGYCRRECFLRKWQACRVPLQHCARATTVALGQRNGKTAIVFQARYANDATSEVFRRRPWPRADLQQVIAKISSCQNPREKLPLGHISPEA